MESQQYVYKYLKIKMESATFIMEILMPSVFRSLTAIIKRA